MKRLSIYELSVDNIKWWGYSNSSLANSGWKWVSLLFVSLHEFGIPMSSSSWFPKAILGLFLQSFYTSSLDCFSGYSDHIRLGFWTSLLLL